MKKTAGGFTAAQEKPIARSVLSPGALLRVLGALLLFGGTVGLLADGFPLGSPASLCVGALAATAAALFSARRDRLLWLPMELLLAVICFCGIFSHGAANGFLQLANQFCAWRRDIDALDYSPYACEAVSLLWAQLPACGVLGLCLGALAALRPQASWAVFAAAVIFSLRWSVGSGWLILLLLGCSVLLFTEERAQEGPVPAQPAALALLIVLAALITAVGLTLSQRVSVDTHRAANALHRAVHALRYEPTRQALPEGDLTRLPERDAETPMLEVTLSEPTPLYLRSFVGQRYTSAGWADAEARDMTADHASLYAWHLRGYNGFSQLAALSELLGQGKDTLTVDVRLLGACRAGRITPYELTPESPAADPAQLRDTVPAARGLFGEKRCSYTVSENLTAEAYALLAGLNERWQEEGLEDYLSFEDTYRAFVYKNYLAIPTRIQTALSEVLGEAPQTITSYEAKRRITAFLETAVEYSDTPAPLSGGEDPVLALLQEGAQGCDVHYATAAAVMLRYFGIPARYVEGYLVTPAAIAGCTGEIALTLTGQDAHAWAEYYEDGVGWVPFEAAPAYYDVMPQPQWLWFEEDENALLSGSAAENGQGTLSQTQRQNEVEEETPESGVHLQELVEGLYDYFSRLHLGPRDWLYVLLILLAGAIGALCIRRGVICRRRSRCFTQPDANAAAAAMCAYVVCLARLCGVPWRNVPLIQLEDALQDWAGETMNIRDIITCNAKALYSNENVSPAERQRMREQTETALAVCKSRWSPWQRFYRRWICCLY